MEPLRQLRADDLAEVLDAAALSMVAHAPGLDRLDRAPGAADDGTAEVGDTGRHLVETMAAVAEAITPGSTLTELADDLASAAQSGVGSRRSATRRVPRRRG